MTGNDTMSDAFREVLRTKGVRLHDSVIEALVAEAQSRVEAAYLAGVNAAMERLR